MPSCLDLADLNLHQVLAPDDAAAEDASESRRDFLVDAGPVEIRQDVREHERLHAGARAP